MIEKLRALKWFRDVPLPSLEVLAKRMEERRLAPGEVLFREGDDGDALYVLGEGEIEIRKEDQTIAVLHGGDTLGEMALFEREPRSATAVASRETTVHGIQNGPFLAFLFEHTECGVKFLFHAAQDLSARLRTTSEYLSTVFETGRIVGSGLAVDEMAEQILCRLLEDVAESSGGMILLYNPFGESYEVTSFVGASHLDLEQASDLVGRHADEALFQETVAGRVLGSALKDAEEQTVGWILLGKDGHGEPFTVQQEVVVAAVAQQTGLGLLTAYGRQEEEARRRLERHRMQGY